MQRYTIRYKSFSVFIIIEKHLKRGMNIQIGGIKKMPLSARNRIEGVVKAVEKGEVASTVKIEVAKPVTITAMITKEAVEELGLKEGDKVEAVIKATEVLVSKD